jgi:hypothetical protein
MVIDPKAEQPARTMLGHAIRHELDGLADDIRRLGDEKLAACVPLWAFASAYIAIDISGRWPTDADLHEIAARAAKSLTRLDISEQEIYEYLSRVALGFQRLDEVFSDEGLATVPLYATANLLSKFTPDGKDWWEYLDQIWDAAETAERAPLSVLPALMLRARRQPDRSTQVP